MLAVSFLLAKLQLSGVSLCLGSKWCWSFMDNFDVKSEGGWWWWGWPCWSGPVGLSGVWWRLAVTTQLWKMAEHCPAFIPDLRLPLFIPDLHCAGIHWATLLPYWPVICFTCAALLSYLTCALLCCVLLHSIALSCFLHKPVCALQKCTALYFAILHVRTWRYNALYGT